MTPAGAATLALLCAVAALPAEPWERVQSLAPNQAVKIYLRNGSIVNGRLQSAGAGGLTALDRDGRQMEFARDDIARISRKSRARGALWGVIIGFGVGAPVGAYAGPYLADWGNPSAGVRLRHAAGWGMFTGGIGAGIGALAGMETTVYKAR